jgi:putative CocE/NonD family hydrolase
MPRASWRTELYEYGITLLPVANRFRAGHRIRIEVASASFPAFDRNFNTGNPFGADESGVPAVQLVHHDAEHPSHVLLPVVPRR